MPFLHEKTTVGPPTYNSAGPATHLFLRVPARLSPLFLHSQPHRVRGGQRGLACVGVARP